MSRSRATPVLTGARVQLRPLEERDLAAIERWDDDEEVVAAMGKKFQGDGACTSWFAALQGGSRRRAYAIENERGELIGELEVDNLCPKDGSAELTICIGERAQRGQGYGTEAISLIRDYLFARTRLKRIYLRVYRSNVRAIRCYEKCGFVKRAVLPLSARQVGRREAVVLMEVTRPDLKAGTLDWRQLPYGQRMRSGSDRTAK